MTNPTEEQLAALNVRIAELCGWQKVRSHWEKGADSAYFDGRDNYRQLPNYTGSLDAAHEVLRLLDNDTAPIFERHLSRILTGDQFGKPWLWQHAPWQVCIALDRTLSETPIV